MWRKALPRKRRRRGVRSRAKAWSRSKAEKASARTQKNAEEPAAEPKVEGHEAPVELEQKAKTSPANSFRAKASDQDQPRNINGCLEDGERM